MCSGFRLASPRSKSQRADLRFELETALALSGIKRRGDLRVHASVWASSDNALKAFTIPVIQPPAVQQKLAFAPKTANRACRGVGRRQMEEKFHKKVQQTANINIHNDLDSAALYFTQIVKDKVASSNHDALTFDCMAAGTMLAFSFEAYLNFMGARYIGNWNERAEYHAKIDKVFQHLKISPDWSRRPYSSLSAMKRLRNTLAHGKPETVEVEKAIVDKADGQKGKKIDLSGSWEHLCSPDMIINAHDDLEKVWHEMIEKSGIDVMELMTSGEGAVITGKKFVPPQKPQA
jgi:hypothetical protein